MSGDCRAGAWGGWVIGALSLALAGVAAAQDDLGGLRNEALALVNADREENDLPPLAATDALERAAQAHAQDMLDRGYYAHVSPDGGTVRDRFIAEGGGEWELVAENIARCEGCPSPPGGERVQAFHAGWMDSPEHRANILASGLEGFGFGMASGGGATYAVQTFAGPGTPEGAEPGEVPSAIAPEERSGRAIEAVNRARRDAGLPPFEPSPALDTVAARVIEESDPAAESLDGVDVFALLPADAAADWTALATVSATCGGCGAVATAQDIANFTGRWLQEGRFRDALLDPQMSHLGFALQADGEGRKTAVAIAGRR